ncbi:PLP-dependent transferase [Gonapodya prolifera JEL478]|uniref:PLP-dependent transferase n=1 Tax=Gonapodya prolifera (strain JEL478) TaxID=1344416 RepID=A0A139ATL6_GONPJ|nr:PLP-dependent transferase [Gonapodya prolifera JEL478]|eukprot:KXS20059.1 PLP-dependent transferase [Gonapodya prolifera JEL478]
MSGPSPVVQLSKRSAQNVEFVSYLGEGLNRWADNAYCPNTNCDGIINLGTAENRLMWPEVIQKLNSPSTLRIGTSLLSYGPAKGSLPLRMCFSNLFNTRFNASPALSPEDIAVFAGCGSCISAIGQVLADPGDVFLVPAPYYGGFETDLKFQSGVEPYPINLSPLPSRHGSPSSTSSSASSYHSRFRWSLSAAVRAYDAAISKGKTVRALLMCNPGNPFADCYSEEELREMTTFCAERELHLVSDEIYALSEYGSTGLPKFKSMLSMDLPDGLPKEKVHVLYGMSKDFCMNGLRVGVIATRSQQVQSALGSLYFFHNISNATDSAMTQFLSDRTFVDSHIRNNALRLRDIHSKFSAWLDERKIGYLPASAGFFVWVDLRRWVLLLGGTCASLDLEERAAKTGAEMVMPKWYDEEWAHPQPSRAAERLLWERFLKAGVYIALGEAFYCRDMGWFRIVFSPDNWETLRTALERMERVLREVERELECEKGKRDAEFRCDRVE